MTQSAKDFITHIWISHLVADDPFGDDFYAQMLGALQRSPLGTGENNTAVVQFGSYGGILVSILPGLFMRGMVKIRMAQNTSPPVLVSLSWRHLLSSHIVHGAAPRNI